MAVSLDIQAGLYAQVCYSDEHDHAPGYGPWMYKKTLEFVRQTRHAIRKKNPKCAFGYEMPCEIWIQETHFQYDRPYVLGLIPLFNYIYHEYTLSLGGDVAMGLCHPEVSRIKHATLLVDGIQNLAGIGEGEYDFTIDPNYPVLTLLRNICQAQRIYAHKYLVFGQRLRPTKLEVSAVNVDIYKSYGHVDAARVIHSVWTSPTGKIGYILVNWTGVSEEVTLTLISQEGVVSIITSKDKRLVARNESRKGRVTVVVPPRDVILVEQCLEER